MNSLSKAVYQKAKELYEGKQYRKAEAVLKGLFQENSKDIHVNHLMAVILMRLNRKPEVVVGHLKNVIYIGSRRSLVVQAHLLLGYLYLEKGRLGEAGSILQDLEAQGYKSVRLYALLGYLHYCRREFQSAESYYKRALELEPENPNSLNNLACTYLETKGKSRLAHECIAKALEKDGGNFAYLDTMGWYFLLVRNFKQAIHYLGRSLGVRWHALTEKRLRLVRHLFQSKSRNIKGTP